jgi:hypothetical protein
MFGNPGTFNYGMFEKAAKISFPLNGKIVPFLFNPQSEAQKLLFKSQCEVQSLQDLALLFEKSQTILKTQAFIMCKRIL